MQTPNLWCALTWWCHVCNKHLSFNNMLRNVTCSDFIRSWWHTYVIKCNGNTTLICNFTCKCDCCLTHVTQIVICQVNKNNSHSRTEYVIQVLWNHNRDKWYIQVIRGKYVTTNHYKWNTDAPDYKSKSPDTSVYACLTRAQQKPGHEALAIVSLQIINHFYFCTRVLQTYFWLLCFCTTNFIYIDDQFFFFLHQSLWWYSRKGRDWMKKQLPLSTHSLWYLTHHFFFSYFILFFWSNWNANLTDPIKIVTHTSA